MVTSARVSWVLLAYRVPRTPSAPRIAIWRRLRGLGVAQLVDGLVGLPRDARTQEQLEWVAQEVEAAGGTAVLWRAETLALHDEQQVAASMAAGRAEEYRALLDRVRAVAAAEEDVTRQVALVRRELRRIRRRDYFPPPEAELAGRAVEDLAHTVLAATAGAGR